MSIGWIFFDSIVLIGLAAVFGYALVKMVRDAQRVIESIEALVRIHNAQEEDIYEQAGAA